MTSGKKNYITDIEISDIKSLGLAPTIGKTIRIQLPDGQRDGISEDVEFISFPSADYSVIKISSVTMKKVRLRMTVNSTQNDLYSLFAFNTGVMNNFDVPNSQIKLEVSGPAVLMKGEDVYISDGSKIETVKGIVKAGEKIDVLFVQSTLMLLSFQKRFSFKLETPKTIKLELTSILNAPLEKLMDQLNRNVRRMKSAL